MPLNNRHIVPTLLMATGLAVVFATSSEAQFWRRSAEIPEQTVISSYDDQVLEHSITLDPAIAGFAPGGLEPPDAQFSARLQVNREAFPGAHAALVDILNTIVATGPRPDIVPQVGILTSPTLNAYAVREDLLVFHTGLFDAIMCMPDRDSAIECVELPEGSREDALAFIVAHEYAHVLMAHPSRLAEREGLSRENAVSNLLGQTLMVTTEVASIASAMGADVGEEYAEVSQALATATAASPWIEAELLRFDYAPYHRDQESLADFFAADLLTATGVYDPGRGADPIRSAYEVYDTSLRAELEGLAEEAADRAEASTLQVAAVTPAHLLGGGSVDQLGNLLEATLIREGLSMGIGWLERRRDRGSVHLYYSAERRADAIEAYNEVHGYAIDPPPPTSSAFFQIWADERTPLQAAQSAMQLLAANDLEGARAQIDSVGESGEAVLDFLIARAEVEFAERNLSAAIASLSRASRMGGASLHVFDRMAELEIAAGRRDGVFQSLDRAEEVYGADALLLRRVEAHVYFGENEAAEAAAGRCPRVYAEDELELATCLALVAPPAVEEEADDQILPFRLPGTSGG